MRALALAAACAVAAACGPSLSEVRTRVAASPHRRVAVFPLDPAPPPDRPDRGEPVAVRFRNKLRQEGFAVADGKKTLEVYLTSMLSRGAFHDAADAATLAQRLGCQVALIGRLDGVREWNEDKPPVYGTDPRTGRSRLLARGSRRHAARAAMRLRLIDAASARVLWEADYSAELTGGLANAEDAVSSVLVDQLVDAYMKQGL